MKRWKTPTLRGGIALILLALGIVMLASASSVRGATFRTSHFDPLFFFKRQFVWLVVGLITAAAAVAMDYRRLKPLAWIMGGVAIAMLLLVLIPGIGTKIGGSSRWFRIGGFSFQPSELAKFAMVVALARWLAENRMRMNNGLQGFILPLLFLAPVWVLIFAEPDLGTTILVVAVGVLLLFLGGTRPVYLGILIVGLVLMVALVVWIGWDNPKVQHRIARIVAFVDPARYPDLAYQGEQSQQAFTMGGFFGRGLGESLQKHFYLPESHTDFILAIIGEELGIIATAGVVVLFSALFLAGITIAIHAPDDFGRYLGMGLTLMIAVQALINVGVVVGCLPTKGLPLPFISYGGSSLLMSMLSVGVLVSIARHSQAASVPIGQPSNNIQDLVHRF